MASKNGDAFATGSCQTLAAWPKVEDQLLFRVPASPTTSRLTSSNRDARAGNGRSATSPSSSRRFGYNHCPANNEQSRMGSRLACTSLYKHVLVSAGGRLRSKGNRSSADLLSLYNTSLSTWHSFNRLLQCSCLWPGLCWLYSYPLLRLLVLLLIPPCMLSGMLRAHGINSPRTRASSTYRPLRGTEEMNQHRRER